LAETLDVFILRTVPISVKFSQADSRFKRFIKSDVSETKSISIIVLMMEI
jgi:hypothetical protein